MKLKQYPKYKDSGIQWIGKIPEDWEVYRLKFLLKIPVTDGPHETPEFIEEGIPFLSVDSIQDGEIIFEDCRYISEKDYVRYKIKCNPQRGDVFLGKAASIGKIARVKVDFPFSIWSPLALLRPNDKVQSEFLEYSLKSDYSQDQIDIFSTSNTQKNISMDDIPRIELIIPDENSQGKIASFLDSKISWINQTIEKDKKLIELLKEKRIALINHAVTKGLNPEAKMKDSEIEWIGKIPEDWEVKKLKYLLSDKKNSIRTGPFGSQLTIDEMYDSDYKVYNQRNVIDKDESVGENYVSKDKFKELAAFKAGPGDLLITSRGTIGRCLRLSNSAELGVLHPCLIKINMDERIILNDYIEWIIEESSLASTQFMLQNNATTIGVIYQDNLKEILIPTPPLPQQIQISEYLDKETSKIDETVKKIEEKISLMEEYKKSLIHHVVTGKVDVRDAVKISE